MELPHVAIGGKMGVGKTTCALHLAARWGYRRYALAEPIKAIARTEFGWDGLKDARGRRLLQEIGTAGRAYDPEIWLRRFDEWFAAERGVPVVIDDLRLLEEAAHLSRRGFRTLIVVRPGFAAAVPGSVTALHATETELDGAQPDLVIENAGTIADLHRALDRAVAGWLGAGASGPRAARPGAEAPAPGRSPAEPGR